MLSFGLFACRLLLAFSAGDAVRLAIVYDDHGPVATPAAAAGASLAETARVSASDARFPVLQSPGPLGSHAMPFACSGLTLRPPAEFCALPSTALAARATVASKVVAPRRPRLAPDVEVIPAEVIPAGEESWPSVSSAESTVVWSTPLILDDVDVDGAWDAHDFASPEDWGCGVRLSDRLGSGKFGEVWKARVTGMDQEVALKMFSCGNPSLSADRIRKEASLLGQLSGEHFPEYFGWMRYNGTVALAMELMPGTLYDLVVKQSFEQVNLTQRLEIFRQLMVGLGTLAEQRLIHRDIKPTNLVVNMSGAVPKLKIVDFGYVRSTIDGPDEYKLTGAAARHMAGTRTYMAPETYRAVYTPLTDVWAAGLVLHELVFEGRLPRLHYEVTEATTNETLARELWCEFDIRDDPLFRSVRTHAFESNDAYLIVLLSLLEHMLSRNLYERIDAFNAVDLLDELSKLPQNSADHVAEVQALIRRKDKEVPLRKRRRRALV